MELSTKPADENETDSVKFSRTKNSRTKKTKLILIASSVLWAFAVAAGLSDMSGYQNAPGDAGKPPAYFPADSRIQRTQGRAALVMLVHPRCPCTRATMGELALLMARTQDRVTAHVLFLKPEGFSDDWEKTDLWQSAASIPGVQVMIDEDGSEANRFHAATSGQTVLYDADGRLIFSGGITASRGHSGDNAGRSAIVSLLNEGEAERTQTPVFGCPLFDPHSECRTGEAIPDHAAQNN